MIKFCFQIYIQNKIYNNINNALLHGPELFWPSPFGIERRQRGGGCVLGSTQPEHITHLPYRITTMTCPYPSILFIPPHPTQLEP